MLLLKPKNLGVGGAIVVVDNGSHLICFERIDGTLVAAANIAIGKVATAIGFKRTGSILEATITNQCPEIQIISFTSEPYLPL